MIRKFIEGSLAIAALLTAGQARGADTLELPAKGGAGDAKHVVLISGDEEYRSEETMPMLAKILSQKHGFKCTVLFTFGPEGADYIDSNNQQGLRGLEALDTADLMIIATRFRQPDEAQAAHITAFVNAGKPVIGLRTATHAFRGDQKFAGDLTFDNFGRKILGEEWVSHHGDHKVEGARSVVEPGAAGHPVLRGVSEIFAPSDVYGVSHLTGEETVLLRGAITKTLDPSSPTLTDDARNNPMQALAWLRTYTAPSGVTGQSFCTTAGASVDFVDEDLRRIVDPFYPTFYGFINDPGYYKALQWKPETFELGKAPFRDDPAGSPDWPFRPRPGKEKD
jgi:Trehalose utilisation